MQRLPRRSPRVNPVTAVVAAVIVAALILGYLLATSPPAPTPPDVVQAGDIVEVNYIGFFPNGRVFDTSIPAVAEDNATWPKAVSFEFRGSYSPLRFQVGGATSTVIEGFEHGVLFPTPMRVGEAREVIVPPEMGYGSSDPTKVEVRPLREELTQFETLLRAEFAARFPQQDPVAGLTFTHPTWGWPTWVAEASGDFVTLMHVPDPGFVLRPFGAWDARVLEVDTSANGGLGRIVVQHLLTPRSIDNVTWTVAERTFRIVDVDPIAGTYTADYNNEVVGKTLVFRMELVLIDRT
ncbi:MAG: FKBP-type peptidyl-prolyl cis-trans isomerase [Thermoplasmata archaeon]